MLNSSYNKTAFKKLLKIASKRKKITKNMGGGFNSINTDIYKNLFWEEGKEYFDKMGKEFIVDEHNKQFLTQLCLYMTNNPIFEKKYKGDLRKGIMLIGDCGTGKSSIFNILQRVSRKYKIWPIWFTNLSVHDLVIEYNRDGDTIIDRYKKGRIHFDDFGAETLTNYWGSKDLIMKQILELRYNEYISRGAKTFCTSNLSLTEIEKRYGNNTGPSRNRVADRIYEMFNILYLEGPSRRN